MNTISTLTGRFILVLTSILSFTISSQAQVSPNMKFVRPALTSGTAGQQGAKYKFANVIAGVDAFLTLDKITNNATLVNIDDTTMGYYNAWQPVVGGPGIVGQSSEIRWKIEFKNTDGSKHTFTTFDISAIDIDGDNRKMREYVVAKDFGTFNLPTAVPTLMNMALIASPDGDGTNEQKGLGPVVNRGGIDTTALDTRVNYKFLNKDNIKITTGATVDNNTATGPLATDRYYSLYFKPVSNIVVSILPVTMRVFDAVAVNNNSANLYWITDTEMGNNHFEVERSFDQIDFRTIGMVLGAQATTNSANQYSFKDGASEIISHNIVYYRLKQVNMDGKYSYSTVKMVRLAAASKTFVQVYPNPYMEKLNINFVSNEAGKAEIRLINATGQIASSKENVITKGYNNFQMGNLNAVAPGIYSADLVINGKTIATQKVVKL